MANTAQIHAVFNVVHSHFSLGTAHTNAAKHQLCTSSVSYSISTAQHQYHVCVVPHARSSIASSMLTGTADRELGMIRLSTLACVNRQESQHAASYMTRIIVTQSLPAGYRRTVSIRCQVPRLVQARPEQGSCLCCSDPCCGGIRCAIPRLVQAQQATTGKAESW